MKSVWLNDLTWEEFEKNRKISNGPILIPVGSVEQHGYHLPLGTDSLVAIHLAEDAANQTSAIVTPPIWFGWSPHHMALPGTITIEPETLIKLLYDVVDSLRDHGITNFIIINGHRFVNIPWMQIAAEKLQRELDVKIAIFDPAYMSKEIMEKLEFGEAGHGEEIETSHMLHLKPNLVQMEKAVDYLPPKNKLYNLDLKDMEDTLCFIPSTRKDIERLAKRTGGSEGQPKLATAEKGKILHEHLVKRLIEVIHEFRD